jgi:protein involved in polysaccharide export with SLBB domain
MINVSRLTVRWAFLLALVLVGSLQMGCKSSGIQTANVGSADPGGTQFASAAAAPDTNGPPPSYVPREIDLLRVGDSMTIEFSDLPVPVTSREERIKEDGTVSLMEGKTFVAAGKTRGQLEREIHDFYVPRYYLKMTVSIKQKDQTQFYYVRGEVKQPTRQIYVSRIRLLQAIASAGDFTDFARKSAVLLTRSDGRKITINCVKARKDDSLNLEILPGDIIDVPRRTIFY